MNLLDKLCISSSMYNKSLKFNGINDKIHYLTMIFIHGEKLVPIM